MEGRIPEFLEEMLKKQYGQETFERILSGYEALRPVTLRVNALTCDTNQVEQELEAAKIGYRKVSWYPDAFVIDSAREDRIRELSIYEAGMIYLQSLSSMLPPLVLAPKAGETVLDMAAAPGGKTTQMAAMTGGRAQITACEKNPARSQKLCYNLERQKAAGVFVMVEDARKLDDFFSFDRILLDAPCSGSGTLQIRDGICRTKISKELVERSAKTQEALLRKALRVLKPGHEMVYSTCSVLREENEGLLKRVLKSAGGELVPIDDDWVKELPLLQNELPGTLLVCPNELFEGFFVAKIRKK